MNENFRSYLIPATLCLWGGLFAQAACVDEPRLQARVSAAVVDVDVCSGIGDGALCNDKNSCTTGDRCQAGICLGMPAADGTTCTDGNQCTSGDLCKQGTCVGTPVPEATACTDGEPCTGPDSCRRGVCTGGPSVVCDDGIACTADSCVIGMGCHFMPTASCPDGDAGNPSDAEVSSNGDGAGPDGTGTGDSGGGDDAITGDVGPTDDAEAGGGGSDGDGDGDRDGPASEDAVPDAGNDAADAADAGRDGVIGDGSPDTAQTLFAVRGGACSCDVAASPSVNTGLVTLGLMLLLSLIRRGQSLRAKRQPRARGRSS